MSQMFWTVPCHTCGVVLQLFYTSRKTINKSNSVGSAYLKIRSLLSSMKNEFGARLILAKYRQPCRQMRIQANANSDQYKKEDVLKLKLRLRFVLTFYSSKSLIQFSYIYHNFYNPINIVFFNSGNGSNAQQIKHQRGQMMVISSLCFHPQKMVPNY